ncbi:MAG: hypothetical protein HY275_09890, partial [Gemmatimonadetes bacterium]|nr:hypothetical protein [Gemmatimonadota bacterium]
MPRQWVAGDDGMSSLGRTGTIVQVSTSPGGVPKIPVFQAWISAAGLEGDWQQ